MERAEEGIIHRDPGRGMHIVDKESQDCVRESKERTTWYILRGLGLTRNDGRVQNKTRDRTKKMTARKFSKRFRSRIGRPEPHY